MCIPPLSIFTLKASLKTLLKNLFKTIHSPKDGKSVHTLGGKDQLFLVPTVSAGSTQACEP